MKGRKIIFFLHILNTNYTHHCGEKGIWRPVKALPVIKKPSIRQPGKSYAQVEADKKRKEEETDENGQSHGSDRSKSRAGPNKSGAWCKVDLRGLETDFVKQNILLH
ncbi:hypothetical protein AVEN_98056-1 [Araneus ventricosus]|uniref:Uncharacterized protein n=1 Tax=Araneus ventricosus TaxID=182803 RepID=A0A4Y2VYP5_ARAVE|nr:hypothetical protein AVEN_98056-1 [Araneus ventricosus]